MLKIFPRAQPSKLNLAAIYFQAQLFKHYQKFQNKEK